MNLKNTAIIGVVVIAAVAVFLLKQSRTAPTAPTIDTPVPVVTETRQALPRLVDLGAGKCIPCKMMKPILDDLKANYADTFETTFIDVWEKPESAQPYKITIIPTQIFYAADGRELFRHEGFLSKEDILAKWQTFGVAPTQNQGK